jgi:hypothetical protein
MGMSMGTCLICGYRKNVAFGCYGHIVKSVDCTCDVALDRHCDGSGCAGCCCICCPASKEYESTSEEDYCDGSGCDFRGCICKKGLILS